MRPALLALLTVALSACGSASASGGPTTEAGTLELGDMTLPSGEYYDAFLVGADEGQWLTVEVTSEAFDPYLIVRSPGGEQSEIDDSESGNTTTTRSVLRVSEAGDWDVIVTSYAPGESGAYSVTYEVTDEQPAGPIPTEEATPAGADSTIAV